MSTGFLPFAIVAILFFFYFSPSTAGNHVSCQVSRYVPSGVILISNEALYPEINGRIPDEDKNFTGSVKAEPGILNITQTQLNMSLIEAAINAEKLIGNDSRAVDAKLVSRNGYIVYEVLLVGKIPDNPFTWLIIDPGNREEFVQITCKCEECKQFAGKWICTDCKCTPQG